jgi:hypothetical protein
MDRGISRLNQRFGDFSQDANREQSVKTTLCDKALNQQMPVT